MRDGNNPERPEPVDWFAQHAPPPVPTDGTMPWQRPGGSTPPTPTLSPQAFIQQYQQSHPVSEGVGPITAAMIAAGYHVSPFMYGSTASHNEISLDGQKYKVLSGEDTPGASWYTAGTYDGGGGAGFSAGNFGRAPTPYASDPNAPIDAPLPTYTAPEWTGGDYVNPTEADLLASPGYQTRLDAGLQARNRSAAAQGTVLNGGTLKALDRYGQDYAQNEYQTLRQNTYDAYKTRYGQFQDKAGMDLNARTVNANDNQQSYQNRATRYLQTNNRTLSDYLTNLTSRRNSELDYWNRLSDVNGTGSNLAGGSR
jgi:hypothetical protein